MKYEGHFLLWYIILMPFAKLDFPYFTTNIISWIITSISAYLILDKAPFKFYKRVLLIFSFPLIYLYPAISRVYCLIPLAIILMCISYRNRKEKPFRFLISIVFLANTHILMYGMVGIVLLDYIIEFYKDFKNISYMEKKKRLFCFIIALILLFISIFPLFGCLTFNKDIHYQENINNNILKNTLYAIFYYPFIAIMYIYNFFIYYPMFINFILSIFIFLLFFEAKNNRIMYLKIYLCVLWQYFIYSFIWGVSCEKVSTIIFILIYFKWINTFNENKNIKKTYEIEKKLTSILWIILLLSNILNGLCFITFREITTNYSNSFQVGKYINKNLNDSCIILSGPRTEFATAIIPFVTKDVKFYQINSYSFFSYTILNENNKQNIDINDIKNLKNTFNKGQKLYYIYCTEKENLDENLFSFDEIGFINECENTGIFKKIFSTDEFSLTNENYTLYEVFLDNIP